MPDPTTDAPVDAPSYAGGSTLDAVAAAVAEGLSAEPKRLSPWLFYDATGSRLYERITQLDAYYPTRTERRIFEEHARAILTAAGVAEPADHRLVELGAGAATKSTVLLAPLETLAPRGVYVPVDVSATAVGLARENLAEALPWLAVEPVVATHAEALDHERGRPERKTVIFIGSSIGNYPDDAATELLAHVADALGRDGALILGTDLRKAPDILIPAYDDPEGVTAAFNRNVLARINRDLGADFDPSAFRHVARWNEGASRVEMHLESTTDQRVTIDALGRSFDLRAGERVHTESSVKYDLPRIDALFQRAGLTRVETFHDPRRWFAVHVARPATG